MSLISEIDQHEIKVDGLHVGQETLAIVVDSVELDLDDFLSVSVEVNSKQSEVVFALDTGCIEMELNGKASAEYDGTEVSCIQASILSDDVKDTAPDDKPQPPQHVSFVKKVANSMAKTATRIKARLNTRKQGPTSGKPMDPDTDTNTVASSSSSSVISCRLALSSMTASTADFESVKHRPPTPYDPSLVNDPWSAAMKGSFCTLSYIARHEDPAIWARKDNQGNVPLYYACAHYSRPGGSFGKYGLECIRLLLKVWPTKEIPPTLLEKCKRDACHRDVVDLLNSSRGICYPIPSYSMEDCWDEDVTIEGMDDVVSNSFLDDLGDDGCIEDY